MLILYLVCFGCYLLFTRQPDYFDGETAPAIIHWQYDSSAKRAIPKAVFSSGQKNYAIDARYVFREWSEGQTTQVIYETENPSLAKVYAVWGYWISWGEIIGSALLIFVLYQVAISVTSNPTPEALFDQLDVKEEKKRKYLD